METKGWLQGKSRVAFIGDKNPCTFFSLLYVSRHFFASQKHTHFCEKLQHRRFNLITTDRRLAGLLLLQSGKFQHFLEFSELKDLTCRHFNPEDTSIDALFTFKN